MAKFIIKEKPFGKRSTSLREVLTNDLLSKLSKKIAGEDIEYSIQYTPERNVGNFIIFEYKGSKNYIVLLNYRASSSGRNSFYQSIPTAYGVYLSDIHLNKNIYFYDVNYVDDSNYEKSIVFALKLSMTIGMLPLNPIKILPYISVDEIIEFRNSNKEKSKQNNPTFIERKSHRLIIYGKVFGANAKDTEILCLALKSIFDGEIVLYQIQDNNSVGLSKAFIKEITSSGDFIIKDDTYSFDDLVSHDPSMEEINLRNPKFIYNLFSTHGEKKCALCSCEIESIIDGAHIYPIEAIKTLDLTDNEKLDIATNPNNGIWLCKNHHKLFDSHLLKIHVDGSYTISNINNDINSTFIRASVDQLRVEQLNSINKVLLNKRYDYYNIA